MGFLGGRGLLFESLCISGLMKAWLVFKRGGGDGMRRLLRLRFEGGFVTGKNLVSVLESSLAP